MALNETSKDPALIVFILFMRKDSKSTNQWARWFQIVVCAAKTIPGEMWSHWGERRVVLIVHGGHERPWRGHLNWYLQDKESEGSVQAERMAMQRPEMEARSCGQRTKRRPVWLSLWVSEVVRGITQEAWKPLMGGLSSKSDNLINMDKAHSGSCMKKRVAEGDAGTS